MVCFESCSYCHGSCIIKSHTGVYRTVALSWKLWKHLLDRAIIRKALVILQHVQNNHRPTCEMKCTIIIIIKNCEIFKKVTVYWPKSWLNYKLCPRALLCLTCWISFCVLSNNTGLTDFVYSFTFVLKFGVTRNVFLCYFAAQCASTVCCDFKCV